MTSPSFSMRQLLEAGIHFGHHPRRWNPKMAPFIFGVRNNVHIINLEETAPRLHASLKVLHDVARNGGRVLFVGTKPQASEIIKEYAARCGQYYVNHRWLGGMMTNWSTVSQSIKRLREYEKKLEENILGLTKKEILQLTRERDKLERAIGGIKEMGGVPDLLFIIDTGREITAVKEARKLGIPTIGVVDTNADPTVVDYPIPGNDDALRAIRCFCELASNAVVSGLQSQISAAGIDLGASAELPDDMIPRASAGKGSKKAPATPVADAAPSAPASEDDAISM